MPDVYVVADNILSPIGSTTVENLASLQTGVSGVKAQSRPAISNESFVASLFDDEQIKVIDKSYTRFESLLVSSITDALSGLGENFLNEKTGLIISSTKGNIDLLETEAHNDELNQRIALHTSAQIVADCFRIKAKPVVLSNACISGVMAILTGLRMIRSGQYDQVIVTGADVISKFVYSGFKSFQALSAEVCKPFDKDRAGLNLGEGAATVILSKNKLSDSDVKVSSGAISNDANHISGPSRTGHELGFAIKKALLDAGIASNDIGYISAHGTATNYNDEMEANAINFAGLQRVPLNSLKPYYGHTLGAAGLIESIIAIHAIKTGQIFSSLGYTESGVTQTVNVVTELTNTNITHALKTASGFGGCNAAMVFSK
ncbi:beta-ketoacyl synthase [Mucilaginibacter myungsuensis]|uniref:Beta-ketoacyl synthase n=1 Tax=Mucilaginibacter myungsuensis TaxID=649104 RepID=A0A929KVR6_9SPHI|nr:beta-ketoacyl synthase [Mucilaginibacter myungsuensis]